MENILTKTENISETIGDNILTPIVMNIENIITPIPMEISEYRKKYYLIVPK